MPSQAFPSENCSLFVPNCFRRFPTRCHPGATPVPAFNRTTMPSKLTKRFVEALKPAKKRIDVYDSELPGLVLRVTPDGVKCFSVLYRAGVGRRAPKRRVTLGRFGTLTVEEARQLAREM